MNQLPNHLWDKKIAINITQDKIEAEFAMLHETSHMIQDFEPLLQDKDKYLVSEYKNKSPEEMVKNIKKHINSFTKELVIDFKNLII